MTARALGAHIPAGRVIVATGCDARHHALATGLIASLFAIPDRAFDIGFIQVGDPPPPNAITDLIDRHAVADSRGLDLVKGEGFALAQLVVKSRLPSFFPGYDVYVWLDGDTWVQNGAGIDQVLHHAHAADVCIHPQIDPAYHRCQFPDDYTLRVYDQLLGPEIRERFARQAMVNSGVFAARGDSPLWGLWTSLLVHVRQAQTGQARRFFSDQIPLHYLIASGQLKIVPLRAVNNWLVGHATPLVDQDTGKLVAPTWPHEEINIVHLVGRAKHELYRIDGKARPLSYEAMQAFRAQRPDQVQSAQSAN